MNLPTRVGLKQKINVLSLGLKILYFRYSYATHHARKGHLLLRNVCPDKTARPYTSNATSLKNFI